MRRNDIGAGTFSPSELLAVCGPALLALTLFAGSLLECRAQDESTSAESERETQVEPDAPASEDAVEPSAETDEASAETVIEVELPLELKPYEVLLSVSFSGDATIDAGFRERVVSSVPVLLRSRLGQMWTVTARDDGFLSPASPAVLDRLSVTEMNGQFLSDEFDKVILLTVGRRGSAYTVAGREWDRSSRTAGPGIVRETSDRRRVDEAVAGVASEVFRPIAMIRQVGEDVVELGIRAGEFPAVDREADQFHVGDYLVTYMRYLDRQRNVGQIQFVPWTFLKVDSVERARMLCHVVSTFRRSPLAGSRRRVELMGIAARPLMNETELTVVPRVDPRNPLVGHRVDILDRLPTEEDPVEDRLTLLTDRHGVIVVPVDPEVPLQHVLVHSGSAVLASVPFIPGLDRKATLELPDDTARLNVEGELQMMQDDLIDVVASRAVITARARRAAREGRWDDVDQFIEDLEALPDFEQFDERLTAVRVPAEQAARRLGDRIAQSRIARSCREFREVAEARLSSDFVRDFRTEMNELRSAAR